MVGFRPHLNNLNTVVPLERPHSPFCVPQILRHGSLVPCLVCVDVATFQVVGALGVSPAQAHLGKLDVTYNLLVSALCPDPNLTSPEVHWLPIK